MIVRPNPSIPINTVQGSELDLILFPIYQTREDYVQDHGGTPPPEPDPKLRAKYWYDPVYARVTEDDGEFVIYSVVAHDPATGALLLRDGKPYLTTMPVPRYLAGRVNIPYGIANEFPPGSLITRLIPLPVPVRQLHPDEELRLPPTPFSQNAIVVNTRLEKLAKQQDDNRPFGPEERALLQSMDEKINRILAMLEFRR